jgi:hypothetical protein
MRFRAGSPFSSYGNELIDNLGPGGSLRGKERQLVEKVGE